MHEREGFFTPEHAKNDTIKNLKLVADDLATMTVQDLRELSRKLTDSLTNEQASNLRGLAVLLGNITDRH